MVSFEARLVLTLERLDSHRKELDSFDSLPGFLVSLNNLNPVETSLGKGVNELRFSQGTADATTPEFRVLLESLGNGLVADDI